jgi:uncharacterized protein YjiK
MMGARCHNPPHDPPAPGRTLRAGRRLAALSMVLLACGCAGAAASSSESSPKSIGLDGYRQAGEVVEVDGVRGNLSGAAWWPARQSLLAVINGPPRLIEISTQGELINSRDLPIADPEGITLAGPMQVYVTSEPGAIVPIQLNIDDDDRLDVKLGQAIVVGDRPMGNRGLEGVAWKPKARTLYAVKEYDPASLFEIKLPAADDAPASAAWRRLFDFAADTFELSDAAGCTYHAATGHLLVLSQQDSVLVETTLHGKPISRIEISGMFQPEGVTMDDDGVLYIVGEPDQLSRFTPPEP